MGLNLLCRPSQCATQPACSAAHHKRVLPEDGLAGDGSQDVWAHQAAHGGRQVWAADKAEVVGSWGETAGIVQQRRREHDSDLVLCRHSQPSVTAHLHCHWLSCWEVACGTRVVS